MTSQPQPDTPDSPQPSPENQPARQVVVRRRPVALIVTIAGFVLTLLFLGLLSLFHAIIWGMLIVVFGLALMCIARRLRPFVMGGLMALSVVLLLWLALSGRPPS